MTTGHEVKRAADIGPAVLALFYDGRAVRWIAGHQGLAEGVISGLLHRAGAVRKHRAGTEDIHFTAEDSEAFVRLVREGVSVESAAEALGKSLPAALAHATTVGLDVPPRRQPASRQTPPLLGSERADRRTELSERESFERGDQALVSALIAQGGFTRYDDGFDWLLNMHGRRVLPVSKTAKGEYLALMREKHGDAVTKMAAA